MRPVLPPPIATVAVVGRPNVGKSTLFNRLLGRRQAIVHDLPGITRDRLAGRAKLDDDRSVELIDTGGLVPEEDPLGLNAQVFLAIEESDLLLFVVDGKEGLVAADERVWQEIRATGKPALLVVNKGDTHAAENHFHDFYRLGFPMQVMISAEHGRGIEELREETIRMLEEVLPEAAPGEDEDDGVPSIAIVGRPNVGKSSLVNRILGESRVLVSPVAGTTRDPIDSILEHEGRRYRLIDTAGIRRRSQVSGAAENLAVLFARRQMERADVVVLLVDASAGLTTGDLTIAGQAWELGRGVVVAINKWDLLDEKMHEDLEDDLPRLDELLSGPSRVNVSALTGRRLDRLIPAIDATLERSQQEMTTGELNRLFERALERHPGPLHQGKPWRVYYSTQVSTRPPTFMLFANRTLDRSDTYRRYLENQLRAHIEFGGIPVRLVIRKR